MSKKLDELLEKKVEILDCETGKQIDMTTVEGISNGFDLYIDLVDDKLVLCDFQDEDEQTFLGNTVEEALRELSKYDEYFNNHYDGWESNFLYELDKAIAK